MFIIPSAKVQKTVCFRGKTRLLRVIHAVHVPNELHDLVGIAPFIVVPGDDLHKVVVGEPLRVSLGVQSLELPVIHKTNPEYL